LNASAIGSTQILLNSRSERYPTGLGNTSGVLGRYLMDHLVGGAAVATFAGMSDKHPIGHRPAGLYMPRFQNIGKRETDFVRGYGYQGGAYRANWSRGVKTPGFGIQLKASLRQPGPWTMFLGAMGECLPRYENHVSLDPSQTDKWGIPLVRIQFEWGPNEQLMAKHMAQETKAMLECAAPAQVVGLMEGTPRIAGAVHEMGTARMGRDPKTSYLNAFNQSHELPNLFISDGACMTSSGCQNPSLTYMALTARAADFAVGRLREHNL
jgi:choline dehydrogenase-like flavoprotein